MIAGTRTRGAQALTVGAVQRRQQRAGGRRHAVADAGIVEVAGGVDLALAGQQAQALLAAASRPRP